MTWVRVEPASILTHQTHCSDSLLLERRKMKVNITRHLPLAMQAQRKTLLKTTSRLYNQGKKFSGKWLVVNIAFTPTMNGWLLNVINTTCCINEFLCFRWLLSKLQFRLIFEAKYQSNSSIQDDIMELWSVDQFRLLIFCCDDHA